ncbi:acyl carrier protein [Mesorhizobium sp. KR2-14]|uniref:acyl carrier protein n=1 Tax=Mesorhizobium sp. KR2-14 TaxID=3156610 RepID=UPI0032B3F1F2
MDASVREKLRAFVRERLPESRSRHPFDDSDSLFLSGQLSSYDAVELILFMEAEFGIDLAGADFDQMLLDTINSITQLVGTYGNKGLLAAGSGTGIGLP